MDSLVKYFLKKKEKIKFQKFQNFHSLRPWSSSKNQRLEATKKKMKTLVKTSPKKNKEKKVSKF